MMALITPFEPLQVGALMNKQEVLTGPVPAASPPPAVEISEETPIQFNLRKMAAMLTLVVTVGGGVWGFHMNAIASISKKNEESVAAMERRMDEKLRQHPTWDEIRKLREDDFKYWSAELKSLKEDIVGEIREIRRGR